MLSRVAERIYWGGRYLERAENTARMISTYSGLLLDVPDDAGLDWGALVAIADAKPLYEELYGRSATEKKVLSFLITDRQNPGSIASSLAFTRENFRTTRDVLPREAWESINSLFLYSQEKMLRSIARQRLHAVLVRYIGSCQQVAGALSETMSHGDAHRFLLMGRCLERADMNSRTLDAVASAFFDDERERSIYENTLWMSVLQSQSAYQMYRQSVRRRVTGPDALSFLVRDRQFPRSMVHCFMRLADSLGHLPRHEEVRERVVLLRDRIGETDLDLLAGTLLHQWIDHVQQEVGAIHGLIKETWFLPAHSA